MLYSNVLSELYGEDREEAMAVIDDDIAFDRWMKRYDQQQKASTRSRGAKAIDQDTYMKRYAVVIGGEEE